MQRHPPVALRPRNLALVVSPGCERLARRFRHLAETDFRKVRDGVTRALPRTQMALLTDPIRFGEPGRDFIIDFVHAGESKRVQMIPR